MKPTAVLSRLEKLSFEAAESWDGSYRLRINRQISGLPRQLAVDLTSALNESVTMVRLLLKAQINKPLAEAQLALELPGQCPECGGTVIEGVCQSMQCKRRLE